MDEEDERIDPEGLSELASTPFKRKIESKIIRDFDGYEFELLIKTRKFITPDRELIIFRQEECSKFLSCGHQVTSPTQIFRCTYQRGHIVCSHCIIQCELCKDLACLKHSREYDCGDTIIRLCQDCGKIFDNEIRKQIRCLIEPCDY